MNREEQLLHAAMEPLGEVLAPLDTLIKGERSTLFVVPVFFILFSSALIYEQPERLPYFPLVLTGIAIFLFLGIRRYRRLKTLYHKIEDWPYTSGEALVEAHSAISSRLSKLYGSPGVYGVIMFSSIVSWFKADAQIFFRNIFTLNNPLEGVPAYVPVLIIVVPVLATYMGKRSHERFITKNYRKPLSRLQEIIDELEGSRLP